MIDFKTINIEDKAKIELYLRDNCERGCEFSFQNLYLWGRQQVAFIHDHMVVFSQWGNHIMYSFPIGNGDKKPVLEEIIQDAKERGISCCISGLYGEAKEILNSLYPERFSIFENRDAFDYVYSIDDLADLAGRKYHRKRTHCNHFYNAFPDYTIEPVNEENMPKVRQMVDSWYEARLQERPDGDYEMEQVAWKKTLNHYKELEMEGILLLNGEEILAVTIGSRMSSHTFDVHFEKARWDVDGAYTIINNEFARFIREKYPFIKYIDREDDMGLDGLRRSKESYYPHHMIEKSYALLQE